jgi:hypothetical protein
MFYIVTLQSGIEKIWDQGSLHEAASDREGFDV